MNNIGYVIFFILENDQNYFVLQIDFFNFVYYINFGGNR